jgi:DNA primase
MNLLDTLEARGIHFKLHTSRENEIYICCPFCTDRNETPDSRFRFGVNYVTGQAHCFNCGKKFRDFEYLKKALTEKLDTGEWQLSQEAIRKRALQTPVVRLPSDFIALSEVKRKTHWDRVALNYLYKRGITDEQIESKHIGYSMVGDFRYRIVIPVYYNGKLEGLVARAFVEGLEPKYRNSLGNKTLFNVPRESTNSGIILSEGAFDAYAIERALASKYNFDSCAVLGHTLTERQLNIVKRYDRIILWTDPDVAGIEGLITMGQQLNSIGKERVEAVVPRLESNDREPSELTGREIRGRLNHVQRWTMELGQSLRLKVVFQES